MEQLLFKPDICEKDLQRLTESGKETSETNSQIYDGISVQSALRPAGFNSSRDKEMRKQDGQVSITDHPYAESNTRLYTPDRPSTFSEPSKKTHPEATDDTEKRIRDSNLAAGA
ncbi:hypothetical protein [Haloarcula sediminis]|uniref:hypothetical protein n=1 Tax=Haloarcula sediminis TaxID=3111777 RepID=UPI002D77C848|nr:hypothetical protein [Haloarcula sp. CK38]